MTKRVVVGMSGGVDSSVAALLLKEQGYDVVGLFMRNWRETDDNGACTAEADYADVKEVSNTLGIPYYTVDFSREYMERVFSQFVEYYKRGLTPNPDVLCNREIKFGPFANYANQLNADFIATGHYCKILKQSNHTYLARAVDENKDQTYFLNQVTEKQIQNVLFPVGGMDKKEVRKVAERYGLSTAEKKDSTGICFIGERNFREFLSKYIPMQSGDIKTLDGKTVGRHNGVYFYTVGQRKGFGLGGAGNGEPWFVIDKDVKNNILYVNQGECERLFSKELITSGFNFITEKPTNSEFRCKARIRHRQPLQDVTAHIEDENVRLEFDIPQRAVARGQYAVLYDGEICLGGGEIAKNFLEPLNFITVSRRFFIARPNFCFFIGF
jgi:tRNA (5-methylaminomethyl-2-thiouridylate)-methyltransferase